jgi:hypothetical protein
MPHFRGMYCGYELPYKPNVNDCGIMNLDDLHGYGTHWYCWFKCGVSKFYFDNFGLQPPVEIINYLKSPIYYNSELLDGQFLDGQFLDS